MKKMHTSLLILVCLLVSVDEVTGQQTFTTFQDASLVIGQPDFTSQITTLGPHVAPGANSSAISSKGVLAVGSQTYGRVLIWNSVPTVNGQAADVVIGETSFTTNDFGTSATITRYVDGVAFSPDGNKLLISDSGNNRVLIWNSIPTSNGEPADVVIGQTDFTSNSAGVSPTKLQYPSGLMVTPDGKLFINDLLNNRVLIYNSIPTVNGAAADVVIGQPDMFSNSPGSASNQLDRSWYSALSPDGKLLISEESNNRVLIFNTVPTTNGASADVVIGHTGFGQSSGGTSSSKLLLPIGVAVSQDGKLAIGEFFNHRVLIFNSIPTVNGATADVVLGQSNFTSNNYFSGGVSAKSMAYVYGVHFDSYGRLFVNGRDMHRVMVFGEANLSPTISTSTTISNPFCAGSTIDVSFTVSGLFNSGNTFTAQLSNATGSFTTPVDIGTFAGTASGAITTTIPANTPAGTGYRIRVVSSNPVVIGSDNGSDITINSLPTATLSGGGVICPGGSASLSVALTGTGPWSVTYTDGTTPVTVSNIVASPHTIAVSPASDKTYSLVSASDVNCNATSLSGTAQIIVNSGPVVTVPTITPVGNDAGACGASVTFEATATGIPTPTVSYAINGTPITSPHVFPVGTTTVTATATNTCGTDSEIFTVTVTNDAPVLGAITPSTLDPVQINTAISASATYTDNNLQSATWNWGDGTTSAGTISSSTISGTRTYTATGVYTIGLSVKDACNSEASTNYQYVVVYDPSGGFVTGGGWINSPAGAYKADLSLDGRANFGFVSKYQKGAKIPSGDTNFEFQTASLHFKSTSYEWLVVSGATARYKGVGTINGVGNYGFILSAIDGQVTGGDGSDKFRIKIWDKNNNDAVVYDNNLYSTDDDALAELAIMGGSIVVHEAKKATSSSKAVAAGDLEAEPLKGSFYSYPTAFSDRTTIAFSLEAEEDYVLEVFDMKGALVKKLASGNAEANRLYEFELRSDGMAEGVYITRLTTTSSVRSLKAVLKR